MTPVISDANKLYLGTQQVSAVYAGMEKVWPAWTTATISGLKIWLDASQLPGANETNVTVWPNLAAGGVPGTMIGTPFPVVRPNAPNGKRVVRFFNNGGRLRMTGTGVRWAHTLAYVGRMVPGGISSGRIVTSSYPSANFLIGYWNGFEDVGFSSAGSFFVPDTKKPVTTNWRLYSSDADASSTFGGTGYHPRMFSNGVFLASGGQADGYCSADDAWYDGVFNISGYSAAGVEETCDCEIAEVILYDHKVSDSDRQAVEDYLREKWLT